MKKMSTHNALITLIYLISDGINDDIEHLVTFEDANLFNECFPEVVCAYDVTVEKQKSKWLFNMKGINLKFYLFHLMDLPFHGLIFVTVFFQVWY